MHIVKDLFDNVWGKQTEIPYDNALDITIPVRCLPYHYLVTLTWLSMQLALYVIGGAGFGRRMGWRDEMIVPPGHRMTFNASTVVYTLPSRDPDGFIIGYTCKRLRRACS